MEVFKRNFDEKSSNFLNVVFHEAVVGIESDGVKILAEIGHFFFGEKESFNRCGNRVFFNHLEF